MLIGFIPLSRCEPEIFNFVIQPIAVYVVNYLTWGGLHYKPMHENSAASRVKNVSYFNNSPRHRIKNVDKVVVILNNLIAYK